MPDQAIGDLTEVLEFFPKTEAWPEACILLAELYLLKKNVDLSHEVLSRLSEQQNLYPDLKNKILEAYWDHYQRQKQFQLLIHWLSTLLEEDIARLRRSKNLEEKIFEISKNDEADLDLLIKIYKALRINDPLDPIILHIETGGFIFELPTMLKLLKLSLMSGTHANVKRVSQIMNQGGWHRDAHSVFSIHRDLSFPKHARTWLKLLMDGSLWEEAKALALQMQDTESELVTIEMGLKNWEAASHLIEKHAKWLLPSIKIETLSHLCQELQEINNGKTYIDRLISTMKDGEKKEFLNITLITDLTTRKEKLETFLEQQKTTLYRERCITELAKIAFKQRNIELLKQYHLKLKDLSNDSPYLQEVTHLLDTLKTIQQAAPAP